MVDSLKSVKNIIDTITQRLCQRLKLLKNIPETIFCIDFKDAKTLVEIKKIFPKANIVECDLIPPKQLRCDLLISNLLLHQVENLTALFLKWRKHLNPGAALIFSALGTETLSELRQTFSVINNHDQLQHFLDLQQLGEELAAQEYQEIVTDVEKLVVWYPNLNTIFHDLDAFNIQISSIKKKQQLQDYYARHFQNHKKQLRVSMEVVYGFARIPKNILSKQQESGEVHVRVQDIMKKK